MNIANSTPVESSPPGGSPKGFRSIDAELLNFRTAWLRTVALAWSNQKVRDALKAEADAWTAYVAEQERKKAPVDSSMRRDISGLLRELVDHEWPWGEFLKLHVDVNKDLSWTGDDWVWPSAIQDTLLLLVPLYPKQSDGKGGVVDLSEENRARALAAYYEIRPSIFGIASGGGGTTRGGALLTSATIDIADAPGMPISDFVSTTSPVRFGGLNPPPGGFMPNGGSFLEFEVVLVSALAKAWDNPSFAKLLDKTAPHPAIALNTIRGFTQAWALILEVENDPSAYFDVKAGQWRDLTPHALTLNLPDMPQGREQAMALAAYNSTGAMFPFTCCA